MAALDNNFLLLDDGGDGGRGFDPGPIDVGDGGDTTSNNVAQSAEQIEEFASEGGGALAIVFGEHIVAGNLVVHKFTAGSPNTSLLVVALGEGQGNLGQHGEWEAALAVYYAGAAQSVSPDGSTAGYRFYNGFISTGVASGPQQVDAFFSSNGLAYSGTALIAIKLTDAVANAEDRPDKLRGRYKGRRVNAYDGSGNATSYGYSTNPAYIAVDRIRAYFEHKYRNDIALAQRKLLDKVDWEALAAWATFNSTNISWDNGTSVVSIPRFECHIAFTQPDLTLADALDLICASCGADWQDDGERIIFLPPSDRTPIHHFNESNIVGAPRLEPRDLREVPNFFVAEFRDLDDTFLGFASTPPVRHLDLINQVGEVKSVRTVPNMKLSQAMRLADRWKRLEADNQEFVALVGDESSIHLLPGDFVMVSHTLLNWNYQLCRVRAVTLQSGEDGVDTGEFTLQRIDDALYSDLAHGPRQEGLTP